ncbi:glycosyltransferase [Bacteroides caecigallinarum]|uniref:glycosyltransferase n=1 Tax=Bacteroides caecigallinarum TaxID=1411144 RepID=UPI00195B4B6C|nr:glycosyltransferase [Bacteroides caecigallinarum]MBM6962147.1 glycosyltransferase [Bacteroides caecigallinarum]
MKVLHIGTLDVNAGGPAMSTYNTLLGLNQQGVDTEIIMYTLSETGKLRGENVKVHYAKAPIEHKLAYSPTLKKEINALGIYDLYHAQGVWQYPTYAIVDVARALRKPYIITPRGMLYPQDIRKSNKFFKMLSLKLRLLDDLNRAACVQVTCNEEMEHCRNLGVTSPIAIIPNPIEIKEYKEKKRNDIFRLGYLGRLSPRKNVESLIYAFHELKDVCKDAELIIIGGGDDKYEKFLKDEVNRLKLQNVRFTGFLSGKEKDEAIASISVLAMPSEFENLGNVVLEGLIREIPCIATKGAPWEELVTYGCGWWVDYSQKAITSAIKEAMFTKQDELNEMGKRGRKLMIDNYSIEEVARKFKTLYEWICYSKDKPSFVFYNK